MMGVETLDYVHSEVSRVFPERNDVEVAYKTVNIVLLKLSQQLSEIAERGECLTTDSVIDLNGQLLNMLTWMMGKEFAEDVTRQEP